MASHSGVDATSKMVAENVKSALGRTKVMMISLSCEVDSFELLCTSRVEMDLSV